MLLSFNQLDVAGNEDASFFSQPQDEEIRNSMEYGVLKKTAEWAKDTLSPGHLLHVGIWVLMGALLYLW